MPLGAGIGGALTGFASGGPWGAALGGLSGLLGLGKSHEDPQMARMRKQQQGISNQLLGYANSVPGSSPDELANMAQARGLLGQQQRAADQRVMGAWNPNQGGNAAQMLANLSNSHIAQQMAQQSGFLQDAAAHRRDALMQAANVGQSAFGMYQKQPSEWGQVAGPLAQMLAYQQAKKKAGGGSESPGAAGDVPTASPTGADLSGAQMQGPKLPGPVDWNAVGASGQLGAPAAEDASIYGAPATVQGVPGATPAMNPALLAILQQSGYTGPLPGMPVITTGINPGATMVNPVTSPLGPEPLPGYGGGYAQALQGAMAPPGAGNEPFGLNGQNNQTRQSLGTTAINSILRKVMLPGGVSLHF